MSPVTHALMSWTIADATCRSRRDRTLVLLAGLLPDLDGFGAVIDLSPWGSPDGAVWFSAWHHTLGHGLLMALVVTALVLVFAERRWWTAALALLAFHLHLLADLLGARGPDGHQWPIAYLWPRLEPAWTWSGQWQLNAWPNWLLTLALLAWTGYRSWRTGRTPLEALAPPADRAVVTALQQRFGTPPTPQPPRA